MMRSLAGVLSALALSSAWPHSAAGQAVERDSARDLERAQIMLRTIRSELRRNYYDTTFHGVDLDARFRTAEQQLPSAHSNSQLFASIAQAVFSLDDSHTTFEPPGRVMQVRYDFELQMVGDSCYVVAVAPGSDAARQGIHPGDRVIAVDRYAPNRREFWKFEYVLRALAPRAATTLRLESAVTGVVRDVTVASRTREQRAISNLTGSDGGRDIWELIREEQNLDRDYDAQFVTVAQRILVWRMPTFGVSEEQIDDAVGRLHDRQALVLDLRDNRGGALSAVDQLLGHLFEHDVVVATMHERHKIEADTAKPHGDRFDGQVIVLIDHNSASASELVARTIQREHRGTVIGDGSAGAVMAARFYREQAGGAIAVFYALSITVADMVMPDGERLEHTGVRPDVRVLPTAMDLASGRDPVLAEAFRRLGYAFDPVGAGRMFGPRRWGMW